MDITIVEFHHLLSTNEADGGPQGRPPQFGCRLRHDWDLGGSKTGAIAAVSLRHTRCAFD